MCFSASVSYSAAAVLVGTGVYAFQQSRQLSSPYWKLWALVPVFFGLQQALEGRVWQLLDAGQPEASSHFAIGFHFFSHFLWLWWLPLSSYFIEPGKIRKRLFGGCAVFGAFAGTFVLSSILFHPEWMSVGIREYSIVYEYYIPYRSNIHSPISAALIYALIILVPLLFSSHGHIRVFGCLAAASSILTSEFFDHAYVSVWCFFAALLSLYLVYMIHDYAVRPRIEWEKRDGARIF